MKNLLIILGMAFTIGVFAQDNVPESFKDSGIKRKLKNGIVQKFDGNKYKIVPRKTKPRKPKIVVEEKKVYKKNAVKLFLGYGPNELERNGNTVELDRNPFVGVGYQRMLNEEISVEVQVHTNESAIIGGGFHF